MKKTLLCLFLGLQAGATFAQRKGEDVLVWQTDRKLTWKDYRSAPNPESDAAASTTTYLNIDYKISGNDFSYTIHSYFSRDKSWGRHKTDYILKHEQGHFDLAEVFARKLNKKMGEYRFNDQTFDKDLDRIYNEVTDEKTAVQQQYDRETNHSIDQQKQEEWLKKINEMLDELKAYADYKKARS